MRCHLSLIIRDGQIFLTGVNELPSLTRENNLDIFKLKGSYAGAMGYGQFIPSSYRAYAVDFDNDGSVDLPILLKMQ